VLADFVEAMEQIHRFLRFHLPVPGAPSLDGRVEISVRKTLY
jgi:hypothetical protein